MPTRRLTDSLLDSLKPDQLRTQYFDTDTRGLSARAEYSGEVTFRVAKMIHGKRYKKVLGRYGTKTNKDTNELTLKAARDKCNAYIVAWQQGKDPEGGKRLLGIAACGVPQR